MTARASYRRSNRKMVPCLLLNHDCRPSALIKPLKVSGRWIIGIQAKQDIFDGSEITISYGGDFLVRSVVTRLL